MTTFTITQIAEIVGTHAERLSFEPSGKWLVCDQIGSRGMMDTWVARLKEAGIPAFFRASERTWGVLAEMVQL